MVIVDRDHLNELFKANETDLSFLPAAMEDADFRCTFTADMFDTTHTRAIKLNLNQNLSMLLPEMVDELEAAVKDEFDSTVTIGNSQDTGIYCRMDLRHCIRK